MATAISRKEDVMSFGAHRNSSTDNSETYIEQLPALIGGIFVTVFIAAPLGYWAILLTLGLLPKLLGIVIALYALFVAARFWLGGHYKSGMSANELARLFWPFMEHDATARKVLPKPLAFALGVVISLIALYLIINAIGTTILVAMVLVVIAAFVYAVGIAIWFWVAKVWEDGITENEVRDMLTWPVTL